MVGYHHSPTPFIIISKMYQKWNALLGHTEYIKASSIGKNWNYISILLVADIEYNSYLYEMSKMNFKIPLILEFWKRKFLWNALTGTCKIHIKWPKFDLIRNSLINTCSHQMSSLSTSCSTVLQQLKYDHQTPNQSLRLFCFTYIQLTYHRHTCICMKTY